jgi:hypothetical protein
VSGWECFSALSLDAFRRTTLSQTWLADRRTEQLLRQRSGRNVDFPIARPASLVTLPSVGDSRRKVWLPVPNASSISAARKRGLLSEKAADPLVSDDLRRAKEVSSARRLWRKPRQKSQVRDRTSVAEKASTRLHRTWRRR